MNLQMRENAAETLAAIAEPIPEDEPTRAILFLTAGLLDMATDLELVTFALYIQHFGMSHCEAIKRPEKDDMKK